MKVMKKLLILLIFSFNSYSYVDLGLNYSFSRSVVDGINIEEDEDQKATSTIETLTVNWAWYIWEYTAMELNYSKSSRRLVDDREYETDDATIKVIKQDSVSYTEVAGIGIKQSFANRKSFFIPSISIGYAKMITSGERNVLFEVAGNEVPASDPIDKEEFNSSYVGAELRFRLTKLIGITLSARSVMPDFETDKLEDNLTYSAGFSWVF
jgi:hypothetical protein